MKPTKKRVEPKGGAMWPYYLFAVVTLGGFIYLVLHNTGGNDGSKISAPNDRKRAIAPTSTVVAEDPMVNAPPPSGSIAAPSTVAKPPPDAIVTSTGLASKQLLKGSGSEHPT